MADGSRTLAMLAAGVVLLMAATLVADVVVLSSNAISVTGNPPGSSGALIYAELQGAGSSEVAVKGYTTANGIAIQGFASSNAGVVGSSGNSYGVSGESVNLYGVFGRTLRGDNNYGLYTLDNLYSANLHTLGSLMQVAQNTGTEILLPGDVVTFRGIHRLQTGDSSTGEPGWATTLGAPVVQVAKASVTDGTGVAGVVFSRYVVRPEDLGDEYRRRDRHHAQPAASKEAPQDEPREITPSGPVEPGDLVLVVVHGPAEVRVEPYQESIEPGDLLVAGGIEGHAAKALVGGDGLSPYPGTVLGTALERVEPERDTIYAYVNLH
jgi:hypothetical protein